MTDTTIDIPALHVSEPHPKMSNRYQFFPTRELIQPLLEDHWEITRAIQIGSRYQRPTPYGKHLLRLTHPSLRFGDDRLEAVIRNSHDGSSKFEFMLGAWRLICSNGMMIGTSFADFTLMHLQAFELVQERAHQIIERAPDVLEVFSEWKARQTSEDERHALAVAAAFIRFGPNHAQAIDPHELLTVRRSEDRSDDLWTVFQRVQENTMQGGVKTLKNARRTTRPIRQIDATVSMNKALWRAAEALGGAVSDLALAS
jgi:Domain of unknown function (DUF932)